MEYRTALSRENENKNLILVDCIVLETSLSEGDAKSIFISLYNVVCDFLSTQKITFPQKLKMCDAVNAVEKVILRHCDKGRQR